MKILRIIYRFSLAIWELLKDPKKLYFVLNNKVIFKEKVKKHFPTFKNGLPEVAISDLGIIDEQINPYSFLSGTSSPLDLALLRILAKKFTKCRYMEVGTWRGESLVNLEDITENRTSLSFSHEQMINAGASSEIAKATDFYLKGIDFKKIRDDSQTFDFSQLERHDLIFIDGDHHYQAVQSDTQNIFQHITLPGSIVVWHDYTQHASTINWEVFYGILLGTPPKLRSRLFHIRATNCVAFLPFDIDSSIPGGRMIPQESFHVHIKIDK
ncbi:MAG: class I SAM-dependent methyltransferase [Cyclobacteriaceae bacterium]|nr:class I SAM-dependent methyltransferase [Cyclobacteriaceae bacterium HetDA_MAG_MS6]